METSTQLQQHVCPQIEGGEHKGDDYQISAKLKVCPSCRGAIVILDRFNFSSYKFDSIPVFPTVGAYKPAPLEVPPSVAEDFNEANLILGISPKASAALSRRCLQAILSAQGHNSKNLVDQIDAALSESDASKALPPSIKDNLDAIRNFGNFSAHPITDKTTLQVVAVEEGEAEWCIEILMDLFDHFYVGPAKAAIRRASLAKKLSNAGKPPMKN